MNCLLCQTPETAAFKVDKTPARHYRLCTTCDLIFMEPAQRLTLLEEKQRYDEHGDQGSPGHLAFLDPLLQKVVEYYKNQSTPFNELSTLDFGCGQVPVVSKALNDRGFKAHFYDLFYFPNVEEFRRTYHVVTSTEVWEHLATPKEDIEKQLRLLKSGGLLAVMTSSHKGEATFHDWYYRRDPTHITFYSEKTMNWLAKKYGMTLLMSRSPYWVFLKL